MDFDRHGQEIYDNPNGLQNPVLCWRPSVTDPSVAPAGCENLFFLIPIAAGLKGDSEEVRGTIFQKIVRRFEQQTGHSVRDAIVYKRSYSVSDFMTDYHAFKGKCLRPGQHTDADGHPEAIHEKQKKWITFTIPGN